MSHQKPRMVGQRGLSQEQQDRIWDLHVKYNLGGKVIAARMGMGESKVSDFLKKRREQTGVDVKVDHFVIARPVT